jgi:hypothetical protein
LYMDHYSPQLAPGGQMLPPPAQPRVVRLTTGDSDSVTTGGTAESERTDACGNVLKFGHWTSKSSMTFVAQISGLLNPTVQWKVNGQPCSPATTSIDIVYNGTTFHVGCVQRAGGRALTLSSGSADTYSIPVTIDVSDVLGAPQHADSTFEVAGEYDGMRIEDIRAASHRSAS